MTRQKPPHTILLLAGLPARGDCTRGVRRSNERISPHCAHLDFQMHFHPTMDVSLEEAEEIGHCIIPMFLQTTRTCFGHGTLNIRLSPRHPFATKQRTPEPQDRPQNESRVWGSVTINSRAEHSNDNCTMQWDRVTLTHICRPIFHSIKTTQFSIRDLSPPIRPFPPTTSSSCIPPNLLRLSFSV